MLIVSDRNRRNASPPAVNGKPVGLTDIASFVAGQDDVIVIDIDLSNLESVVHLQKQLGRSTSRPFIACAVEAHSYRARSQAYSLGATVLLPRPFAVSDLEVMLSRATAIQDVPLSNTKSVENAADILSNTFAALNAQSNLKIAEVQDCGDQVRNTIAQEGLQNWLTIVRSRHEGTFQHCLIVTGLITNFARHWGMGNQDVERFATIGLLHDIGKVRISKEILDKPGKLTPDEFEVIKSHPVIGYDYLSGQEGMSDELLSAVRHHHEALDGSGYPDGLNDKQIDDSTRILTVCDIYGAMIEYRPYKRQALPEEAIGVLLDMAGRNKVERALVLALAKSVDVNIH